MEDLSKIPSIKIVLFGPSGSGKTTMINTFLNQGAGAPQPTTSVEIREIVRQYQKRMGGRYVPTETYRLIITDTPGAPDAKTERRKGLQKSVGVLFVYDATDPQSPRELLRMIKEEIIKLELYYNLMGIVVVGTKKDLGVNADAISGGEEVVNTLNSIIESLWGYKVPHIVISAIDSNEVGWAIYILESIIMDKPPTEIIQSLSPSSIGITPKIGTLPQSTVKQEVRREPQVIKQPAPTIKAERKHEIEQPLSAQVVMEERREETLSSLTKSTIAVETPKQTFETPTTLDRELSFEGYKIRLHTSERIWGTLEKLVRSRPDTIKEVIFIRKAGEILYVAFYPGPRELNQIKKDVVIRSIEIEKLGDRMAAAYNIEMPQMFMIKGFKESVMVIKRKDALLIVKTEGLPSEELIRLLV